MAASTPKSQLAGTFLKKPETVEERAAQEDGGEEPPVKKPNLEAAENEVDRTLSKSKTKEELRSITTSQGSHVSSGKSPGTSRKVHFQEPDSGCVEPAMGSHQLSLDQEVVSEAVTMVTPGGNVVADKLSELQEEISKL